MTRRIQMKTSWQNDPVLCSIIEELQGIYHCHTIILYGSRARGDFKPTSDYDVAGITSMSDKKWIARFDEKHQVFHDIFIFPEKELVNPGEDHLPMADGIVIIEHNDFGTRLLEKLKNIQNKPLSITNTEIKARKIWYKKMLARAEIGDLEGKYRHIWAIYTILEDYFAFKKLRFHGPKKAFQYLSAHEPNILHAFDLALSNTNDLDALKNLIDVISEPKTATGTYAPENTNLTSSKPNSIQSIHTAPHFNWGDACDGWWLHQDEKLTVISERMPPNTAEKKHYHTKTDQFFYCLKGELYIHTPNKEYALKEHNGVSIPARIIHQVKNRSENDVRFLIISSPHSRQDRVEMEE